VSHWSGSKNVAPGRLDIRRRSGPPDLREAGAYKEVASGHVDHALGFTVAQAWDDGLHSLVTVTGSAFEVVQTGITPG
jgi:hypothetical protein